MKSIVDFINSRKKLIIVNNKLRSRAPELSPYAPQITLRMIFTPKSAREQPIPMARKGSTSAEVIQEKTVGITPADAPEVPPPVANNVVTSC